MQIRDQITRTLYAQLARQWDDHKQLMSQLTKEEINGPYVQLITAAFLEAVQRRFLKAGQPASEEEVIDYVASSRARSDDAAETIDPVIAEKQINVALERLPPEAMDDVDNNVAFDTQVFLLSLLVADADYTPDQLSEFVERSRDLAEEFF
ncbi:hypothetical protein [Actinomadura sp. SCN-SB]|uniref:hypothetical protein n=1 Tax=Actinomadura sp. SCN-SB TaxID=3373092 RepID=UPI003750A08A